MVSCSPLIILWSRGELQSTVEQGGTSEYCGAGGNFRVPWSRGGFQNTVEQGGTSEYCGAGRNSTLSWSMGDLINLTWGSRATCSTCSVAVGLFKRRLDSGMLPMRESIAACVMHWRTAKAATPMFLVERFGQRLLLVAFGNLLIGGFRAEPVNWNLQGGLTRLESSANGDLFKPAKRLKGTCRVSRTCFVLTQDPEPQSRHSCRIVQDYERRPIDKPDDGWWSGRFG
jgi:hypothetical protein